MAKQILTHNFSEPLCQAASVKVEIDPGDGNLVIGSLPGGEQALANGVLQYLEKQGLPLQSLETSDGQATFTLKANRPGQTWLHLPWSSCNGATEWQIFLNPSVRSEIEAKSAGGNLKLDLTGMSVTRLSAVTGGGNIDLALPECLESLSVSAESGAGNVSLRIPAGAAVRVQASSGLGKIVTDSRFIKIDKTTYQTPDFDESARKTEIRATTGAGNVIVSIE